MAEVILTGDQQLIRRLDALDGPVKTKVVKKASREGLRPVLAAAKRLCPRKSGDLYRSIKIRQLKRGKRGRIGCRVTTGTATGDFSGDTYYGGFVEYGHKIGRRSRGVKAAQALARRGGLNQRALWFVRRRKRAEQRAEKARRADRRREVAGVKFMQRAASETKSTAQNIFRNVARQMIPSETLAVR